MPDDQRPPEPERPDPAFADWRDVYLDEKGRGRGDLPPDWRRG